MPIRSRGTPNQTYEKQLLDALEAFEPRSKTVQLLIKVPILGHTIRAFRELYYFPTVFFLKSMLAESEPKSNAFLAQIISLLVFSYALASFGKLGLAGTIVTFTQPNLLSIFLFVANLSLLALFLQSLLSCCAYGFGTWRRNKGEMIILPSVSGHNTTFEPSYFSADAFPLHEPSFASFAPVSPMDMAKRHPITMSYLEGEGLELMEHLADDAEKMVAKNRSTWDDLPLELSSLYNLNLFMSHFQHGGHEEVLEFMDPHLPAAFEAIDYALTQANLPEMRALIQELRQWCEETSYSASSESGPTSEELEFLEFLDGRLIGAMDNEGFPDALVPWVKTWTFLSIVDDQDFKRSRAEFVFGENAYAHRQTKHELNKFRVFLSQRANLAAMLALKATKTADLFVRLDRSIRTKLENQSLVEWKFSMAYKKGYLREFDDRFDYHPHVELPDEPELDQQNTGDLPSERKRARKRRLAQAAIGPISASVPSEKVVMLEKRLAGAKIADLIIATLAAVKATTQIDGMAIQAYQDAGQDDFIFLIRDITGNLHTIAVLADQTVYYENMSSNQQSTRRAFEGSDLLRFTQQL